MAGLQEMKALRINDDNIDVRKFPIFSIRSDPVSDARRLFIRPTIPEGYWWVPVENMPARVAAKHPAVYIRSAFAQLKIGFSGSESERRLKAIILGIARSVMTSFYELETARDFNPGELAKPIYKFIPARTVSSAGRAPTAEMIVVDSGAVPTKSADAQAMTDLTDAERALVVTLMTLSVAIPAMQGYSLIVTQHHFLSETNNQGKRAFEMVEREFFGAGAMRDWFFSIKDIFRDTAWHKSGHPIREDLKLEMARSQELADNQT
ncbi:unnamed protein product [Calypogeia fissa]